MLFHYTKAILLSIVLILLSAGLSDYTAEADEDLYDANVGRNGGHERVRGIIVVNQNGSGDHTHIQQAIDNAAEGDTVLVKAGTYNETVTIGKSIDLIGAGSGNTTIDGGNKGDVLRIDSDSVNVSGLTITGSGEADGDVGIELNGVVHCRIEDCTVLSNLDGISLRNGSKYNILLGNSMVRNSLNAVWLYVDAGGHNVIRSNTMKENGKGSSSDYPAVWMGTDDNEVTGNLIFNNGGSGIYLYQSSDNIIVNNTLNENEYRGISLRSSDDNVIASNTLSLNSNGIHLRKESTCNIILNNICSKNDEYGIYVSDSSSNTITRNNITNNDQGVYLDSDSEENEIYQNDLIGNNPGYSQAYDYGQGNRWSRHGWGNHWSDWRNPDDDSDGIVDIPYEIESGGEVRDDHPLVQPASGIDIMVDAGPDIHVDVGHTARQNCKVLSASSEIVNFTWSFSCGNAEINVTGPAFSHTYQTPGTYIVILEVTDTLNRTAYDELKVIVRDSNPPVASGGPDVTVEQHGTVILNASGSSDDFGIVDHRWSFTYDGREEILSGVNAAFTFHSAGTYLITLEVIDGSGNIGTDTLTVTVKDITPPTANAGLNRTVEQHRWLTFDGSRSSDNVGIVNHTWTFEHLGTVQVLYGPSPRFLFDSMGIYDVSLVVRDGVGRQDDDKMLVIVVDGEDPRADAGDDLSADAGDVVDFDGSGSTDNVGIDNYTWIFFHGVDIEKLYGPSPSYVFTRPGNYTVTLKVKDGRGQMAVDRMNVSVADPGEPTAPVAEEAGEPKEEDADFPWYWIVMAVVVVGVGGLLYSYVTRRKRGDRSP